MNRRLLLWQTRKVSLRIRRLIYSQLYRNPNTSLENSILVAGTARSGTTWLADILAGMLNGRILFEPFNPRLVQPYSSFHYFQYMRPDEPNEALKIFCHQVLTGNLCHPWIDRQVDYLNAENRIIKAIRANLMLKWLHGRFPQVPLIFIIRHPCAVVLSRMQLGWDTDKDIEPFLAQPKLVEDFLEPYLDMIAQAKTDVEKHAIIWCISNLIPLKQFEDIPLHILFYEHLCTQPETELRRLISVINYPYQRKILTKVATPSATSRPTSAIVLGSERLTRWQNELSAKQAEKVLTIVNEFGLSYLYGDGFHPICSASEREIANDNLIA